MFEEPCSPQNKLRAAVEKVLSTVRWSVPVLWPRCANLANRFTLRSATITRMRVGRGVGGARSDVQCARGAIARRGARSEQMGGSTSAAEPGVQGPALTQAVGTDGQVTEVDISEPIITAANACAPRGIAGGVIQENAGTHPFAPASIATIGSRFGGMSFADPVGHSRFRSVRPRERGQGSPRGAGRFGQLLARSSELTANVRASQYWCFQKQRMLDLFLARTEGAA